MSGKSGRMQLGTQTDETLCRESAHCRVAIVHRQQQVRHQEGALESRQRSLLHPYQTSRHRPLKWISGQQRGDDVHRARIRTVPPHMRSQAILGAPPLGTLLRRPEERAVYMAGGTGVGPARSGIASCIRVLDTVRLRWISMMP